MDDLDFGKTIDNRGRKDSPAGLSPGTMLGQYRIIRLLGRGGMGEVYEVEHEVLRRRYALKLIPDELVRQKGFLGRFKREAQVTAHLDHPHIVKVDDFGETEEIYWLRMELVGGIGAKGEKITTLAELVAAGKGKIEQELLSRVLSQMLKGLIYAHGKGAIHRDLKPANILLSGNDLSSIEVKISDFGLVRLVGEEWVRSRAEFSVSMSMSLGDKETVAGGDKSGTSTRSILGTYEYMSPEQKRGEEVDARSDLYAVGLMTYRLLTGRELSLELPSQIDEQVSRGWDGFVAKAVRSQKDERYGSASEMLESLDKVKKVLDVGLEKEKQEGARQKEEEQSPAGMALIPAGEFLMGSNNGDSDEKPVHKVYVDAFYMDKYEVTVAQFRKFVEETGYRTDAEKAGWAYAWTGSKWEKKEGANWRNPGFIQTDNHPVVDVSWNDAVAYAKWAGKRLPTEAEWEKAARGGLEGKKYPWGDSIDSSKANYNAEGTKPVGSYPPNGYGLYDTAGNVYEWVADWYGKGYYKNSPDKNPKGPSSGDYRVLRGGPWYVGAVNLRAADRLGHDPVRKVDYIGFRCAR